MKKPIRQGINSWWAMLPMGHRFARREHGLARKEKRSFDSVIISENPWTMFLMFPMQHGSKKGNCLRNSGRHFFSYKLGNELCGSLMHRFSASVNNMDSRFIQQQHSGSAFGEKPAFAFPYFWSSFCIQFVQSKCFFFGHFSHEESVA